MKIKTWLLLSYFIVMILPLVAIYFLFASVTAYYDDKQVEEYLYVYEQIQTIIPYLEDPKLYEANENKEDLLQLIDEQVNISLYNSDGLLIFNSNNDIVYSQSIDFLFQDLYELKQELRAFIYKQPIFVENEFVGLFEITVNRDRLIQTIVNRSWIVTSIFVFIFLFIYAMVAYILHRRLNKRLNELMNEMSAFARGNVAMETTIGKDEIGELKQHFYAMRKQIIAAQEAIELEQRAKEYMIATISHDLKTPLTSIKAYAESLAHDEELSTKQQQTYRKVIIEKADFIKQMLDDLTIHSLLQSKDYEIEFVTVEGDEFFDMLISDYELLCKEKNLSLIASSNVNGIYEVNPQQLIRVVDNLMMNAIQHTPFGKSILIAAFSEEMAQPPSLFTFVTDEFSFKYEQYTYVVVQNEGEGIEVESLEIIFDPLYQIDQARNKSEMRGTGLGLSITKQIIEKHGGQVTAFSKQNVGTCFICSIPKKGGTSFVSN